MTTLMMKFGGASVSSPHCFQKIAAIIAQRRTEYDRIAVVISAMAKTTDMLTDLALQVHPDPPKREFDMMVSVGERISIALLAMALSARSVPAVSFTGSQSGVITSEEHSSARIVDVRPKRLIPLMDEGKIVIVAGFQGCSLKGEITTLGSNGSDISAVAIASALGAEKVEFYKDVGGIFDKDPKVHPDAKMIQQLSYEEAKQIVRSGGRVLHPRCLQLAEANAMPLEIRSFNTPDQVGSLIKGENPRPLQAIYEVAEIPAARV